MMTVIMIGVGNFNLYYYWTLNKQHFCGLKVSKNNQIIQFLHAD